MLEPPFLSLVCERFPSPPSLAKGPGRRERQEPWAPCKEGSANSTGSSAATPPNVLQVGREERALTSGWLQAAPATPESKRLCV